MAASAALSKAAAAKRGLLMFNNLRSCSSSLLNTEVPGVPILIFSNPVAPPVRIVPAREQDGEEGIVNHFKSSLLFLDKAPSALHSDLIRLNVRGRYNEVEVDDDGDFSDGLDEDFSDSDLDDECEAYEDDSDKVEEEEEEEEKPRPRRGGK